jgi:tryptophan synthase alpha chain
MNRIAKTFLDLKAKGEKALIGYVTAGYPSKDGFETLIPKLVDAGLDMLEIGIPFSDPIADGPVIQKASQVALENGVTLDWAFGAAERLRNKLSIPFIFMSYSNPIYAMGVDAFFKRAKNVGVDGLIVPDLIPEVAPIFGQAATREGVDLIYLAAPTTPDARLKSIAAQTKGFLYIVSLTGVTGGRTELPKELNSFVQKARKVSPVPVAVGFGISSPELARHVGALGDGIIVGSALIQAIGHSSDFSEAARFTASLKKELRHAS